MTIRILEAAEMYALADKLYRARLYLLKRQAYVSSDATMLLFEKETVLRLIAAGEYESKNSGR